MNKKIRSLSLRYKWR